MAQTDDVPDRHREILLPLRLEKAFEDDGFKTQGDCNPAQQQLLEEAGKKRRQLFDSLLAPVRRDEAATIRKFLMLKVGLAATANLMPLVKRVVARVHAEDILADIMTAATPGDVEEVLKRYARD